MARLDQMYDHYRSDQLVTLLFMLADPRRNELAVCNAGHPPPVVLRGSGLPVQLASADGPPLGVGRQERSLTTVRFDVADTVVAFTDGLIERRGEDITDGQERVAHATVGLLGQRLVDGIPTLVGQVAEPSRDDDVAVLVARRSG
jgi:serine phosphatase RsbU (regulator of sigma subunit)